MLGPLIAAGASIAGSLLGQSSAKKAANAEYERQKEFAQSGIQWKVQDAEKAGVHPLYALGAQTTSYSPTSVGGTDFGLPDAGQNIGRAIDATRSSPEQKAALSLTASQIEGVNLDNELKRTQLASAQALAGQNQTSLPGLFDRRAMPGQGNSPITSSVPPHHDVQEPQFTSNLKMGGLNWAPHPGWSDAQAYENRYGEMSDYIYGPAIAYSDLFYNTRNSKWNPFTWPYRERHK